MSLELPGAKLLPSATYSGNGEYNPGDSYGSANLYYPSSGDVVISPNLEVTGNMLVDGEARAKGDLAGEADMYVVGSLYGGGLLVPVACPPGVVGGNGPASQAILPLPLGFRISNGGANSSDVTATTLGNQPLVNFANGIQVQGGSLLAQSSNPTIAGVSIGSPTGVGILAIPAQNGMGSISAPIVVPGPFANPPANIQRYTLNGNKGWFLLPACANLGDGTILVISPDPRLGGTGIGRILPLMVPQLGSVPALSLTLGGGYGGPSDFTFINSRVPGTTWLVGVEYM